VRGSPLSGGYAGAKATIKFISAYAGMEARRNTLAIRFVSVLPQITPATGVGSPFVAAYARSSGLSQADGSVAVKWTAEGQMSLSYTQGASAC
jgi:hypothetical protein